MGREDTRDGCLVVAVWKEKLTLRQSVAAAQRIASATAGDQWPFTIALAPSPFAFAAVSGAGLPGHIKLCSQNVLFEAAAGSYIGETTVDMLTEIGCDYAIVGHSERRLHFHEDDSMVARRALAALKAHIRPILCIGDTAEDRQHERQRDVLTNQLRALIDLLPSDTSAGDIIIAYEPVWAISTWRNDLPLPDGAVVRDLHAFIRDLLKGLRGSDFATKVPILYGGSVSPDNANEYMRQSGVDGALVGGASKTPETFVGTLIEARLGFKAKML